MNTIPIIAENLHVQDARMTNSPIFIVQQKNRICGLEDGYSHEHIWVDESSEEVDDEEEIRLLDEAERLCLDAIVLEEETRDFDDYRKVYYRDEYVFVQPFFTEHGAQEYIKVNGHNLREPRIYVESGYRNEEWRLIREYLMGLKAGGWKS